MIAFAAPWVLWGLAAAAVPALLHLFARREPPTQLFPAVRYLDQTARRHQRRMHLQHWLLLAVRTLLIALLVLAAAGPSLPAGRGPARHQPAALVLIADNSLSSGAMHDGVPVWDTLRERARAVLARSTAGDALILMAADGIVRRGSAATLAAVLDSLAPTPRRLDLGVALRQARAILRAEALPGEIVVLSDLQASAVTAVPRDSAAAPILVARPAGPPPSNMGVAEIQVFQEPWTAGGGAIGARLVGAADRSVPVRVQVGTLPARQALSAGGVVAPIRLSPPSGWHPIQVELPPDELRADDSRADAVRVLPPPAISWPAEDRFLGAALGVLAEGRRVNASAGPNAISVDRLGSGTSLIFPPEDPARIGALNRALAARDIPWHFGAPEAIEEVTDSGVVVEGGIRLHRRSPLVSSRAVPAGVLATVRGGVPWIVRAGDVTLVGSRMDPTWTDLPLTAGFVPFLDRMVTRVARGETPHLRAAPGDTLLLPDLISAVEWPGSAGGPAKRQQVEGGATFVPDVTGIYALVVGGRGAGRSDTAGVLVVAADPRESALARMGDATVAAVWPGSRVVALDDVAALAFRGVARADLRGIFFGLVFFLALLELFLARGWRRA